MTSLACPVRVLIADDQTLFRSGLACLLSFDARVDVVGQASGGIEAVRRTAELAPDVVLMDVRMPDLDGIEATRQIIEANPAIRVLVLTTFDVENHVMSALKAGACGYVLKDSPPEEVVAGILAAVAGEGVLASPAACKVDEMLSGRASLRQYYDGLTAREVEILRLFAGGMAAKQVALDLKISVKTVRNHVRNIYEKLGIYDRSRAVLYAVRKGLVSA